MSREFRHDISLALNVALAATVVALVLHKSPSAPEPSARPAGPDTTATEVPNLAALPKSATYKDIASVSDRRRWLIDQLRAAGVPNTVLGRVALSDFEEDWQKRIEETVEKSRGDADTMAGLQLEQERSQDAEMRAALGEEGFKQWDQERLLKEINTGRLQFTDAEADTLYDLKKKLQERHWELEQARLQGGMDDTEINDAYDKAYADFNQQMKTLLGDERYAKSQGSDDEAAATNLKKDLAEANPSDSQFQDLLKAEQQLNDRRTALDKQFQDDPSSADYAGQIQALNDARDQEYQRVLGTNAFDSLQKQQDVGYTKMKKYETIWGLDDSKVDSVYASLKFYEKAVQDYQGQAKALEVQGQSVDWDAINKNLQQFADQTQQSLQNYLGPASYSKMQQNGVFQFNQFNQLSQRGPTQ